MIPTASPASALVVALALGMGFAAIDGARSFTDARQDVAILAELAAAQMAPRAPGTARVPATHASLDGLLTLVHAQDGSVLASAIPGLSEGEIFEAARMPGTALWASASLGEGIGAVVVAMPSAAVTLPVLGRSGAIALLCSLAFLALRRRLPAEAPRAEIVPPAEAERPAPPDRSWLDEVPHGVARWDAEGRLVSANATFFRLLRLAPETVPNGAPYSAVSRKIAGRISSRPVLDQTNQRVVDVERGDGSAIVLDERGCADGGFISTVTDITERRVADRMLANMREEQRQLARRYHEEKIRAEAASRAKTAFLAHLSHDIRTPLNHIIGFAELMKMETFGPLGDRKYADYLCDIKDSGEALLSAFAQILEFAELEGGRRALKSEAVDLTALVNGTLLRFKDVANRAGLRLTLSTDPAIRVRADAHCLERMIGNLVDNAIRFTPRGGEVRLSAWTGPSGAVVEIADTGVGIAPDQLDRLTQPFALSDAAFTKTSSGVGLGLAIARTIAELSGGQLAIDSTASVGTTVAVSLPTIEETGPRPSRQEPVSAQLPPSARAA